MQAVSIHGCPAVITIKLLTVLKKFTYVSSVDLNFILLFEPSSLE